MKKKPLTKAMRRRLRRVKRSRITTRNGWKNVFYAVLFLAGFAIGILIYINFHASVLW